MFFFLYLFNAKFRLISATIILMIFTGYYGYLQPNKSKTISFQELSILINLTIMYAVSFQENEEIFSAITNVMMRLALMQFCIIVICHFLVYTCQCEFTIIEKLLKHLNRKKSSRGSFDVTLLNIPECNHYNEYQDELVSNDFNNHNN